MSNEFKERRVKVQWFGGPGEEERQRMGEWRGSGPLQLVAPKVPGRQGWSGALGRQRSAGPSG